MKKLAALFLLAQTALTADDGSSARQQSMYQTVVMVGIAIAFFYFLIYRPEKKKRQQREQLVAQLKKGDMVTSMNLMGKVQEIKEQTVVIECAGTKLEVIKSSISPLPGK